MTTVEIPSSNAIFMASKLIPDSWLLVKDVLESGRHEGHRLLLHLLDQVSSKNLSLLDLGIFSKALEEEADFIGKLEGIALFALLAERYGMDFGLDKQTSTFTSNGDLYDVAVDLGINVQRADLPWAMDVVGMDKRLHDTFQVPPDLLPLDILFTIAIRCRDWYEETVGHAMLHTGRHRMILPADVVEFLNETLIAAYGTFIEEKDAGAEDALANGAVRRSLGVVG